MSRIRSTREAGREVATIGRFLIVGMLNAVVSFLLFLLLVNWIGVHYLVANVLVFATWVWFGFELQRVFGFRALRSSGAFAKYLLNQLLFAACGTGLLWALVGIGHVQTEYAYLVSLGIVSAGVYISSRLWVFRAPKLRTRCTASNVE